MAGRFALEADGPCQDAPVELRQGDVHGDVARGEASRRGAPLVALAGAQHQLEDRGVEGFEGAGVGVGDGGVGGVAGGDACCWGFGGVGACNCGGL